MGGERYIETCAREAGLLTPPIFNNIQHFNPEEKMLRLPSLPIE
jgi:hypothetical protein